MKKNSLIIGLILTTLFTTTLFGQFNQPGMKYYPIETEIKNSYTRYDTIPAPEWEFITFPTELMTSYYDYMQGGYKAHPLRLQTGNGDGVYITFHARSSQTANQRQYWAYLDSQGNIFDWETITTYDNWQGYGSIDIHPETGNCIAIWHEDIDEDEYFETPITYDDFELMNIPGFWQTLYIIENLEAPENEFSSPLVYVGNSPIGDSYTRVYILRTNYAIAGGNVQILYKDIQDSHEIIQPGWLDNQITNENGDPMFTDWLEQNITPYWGFSVDKQTSGRIAFIGYAAYFEDPPNPPVDEGFFVYESLDWGETWSLYDFGMPPAIENLLQLEDNQGNVLDSIEVGIIGFNNTALFDVEGNLHWCYTGSYGYTDDAGNWNYFDHFIPAGEFVWFGEYIVEWRNVWPKVPWEVEGQDTLIHYSLCTPFPPDFCYLGALIGNSMKNAINCENEWIVQAWADGTYHMLGEDGVPQYQDYIEHPILFMSCSNDNGEHWTEPIEITDIYTPPFDEQITVYPYICDQIVDLEDGWGQVYMYYLDDNEYGPSFCPGIPPMDISGQITYCSFRINFADIMAVDKEKEMPSPEILLYNYPNPFGTSTTIYFSLATNKHEFIPLDSKHLTGQARINIYNIKGELIKQLSILNIKSSVDWDGKDENSKPVSSGIYFYKLEVGDKVIDTKKCLILR
ncbi:MAG: T9SS type A sorting domain-containing protein [Candidatus Cloacimonetes bacterium]|nr:T9SS type A sorting domain-containing protein [Candidatus Cloacimonadota bacterium]MBL7086036.1 T9SS type A sorting domain-containing protein [Candidatus Cloacimonadota bacterium]